VWECPSLVVTRKTSIPTEARHRLTDEIVTGEVEEVLLRHLPIKTRTQKVLVWVVRTLLAISANKESVNQVTANHFGLRSRQAFDKHLKKLKMKLLIPAMNRCLQHFALMCLGGYESLVLACDMHDLEWYGDKLKILPHRSKNGVRGGKRKSGSNQHFSFMTLYVTNKGKRVTLAIIPMERGMKTPEAFPKLWKLIDPLSLSIKCVLFDREFCHARFIRMLRSFGVTFAMPCPKTNRIKALMEGNTHSFKSRFEFRSADGRVREICQVVFRAVNDKKEGKRVLLGYAVSSPVINHDRIVTFYKRRFGIEASYRLAR